MIHCFVFNQYVIIGGKLLGRGHTQNFIQFMFMLFLKYPSLHPTDHLSFNMALHWLSTSQR